MTSRDHSLETKVAVVKSVQDSCKRNTEGRLNNHADRIKGLEDDHSKLDKTVATLEADIRGSIKAATEKVTHVADKVDKYIFWGTTTVAGSIFLAVIGYLVSLFLKGIGG